MINNPNWRTSSYSAGTGGECVEVADNGPVVRVRDTKDRAAGELAVAPAAWSAFVEVTGGRAR
ncbi:DUF397 domain-containing protein [Streptomyces sp. LP05-1]|uniref:DUF397 domain-containing protein n=1 Tax=Streptomyces pyxinae TaxID=2970734 RepID=A0ABT2CBJ8_9ACTN|nr:DUF397 domain-containing protein [Streptomyces sp. LP05-1]MCS0634783.1 DUF397 domain-containing protein [Streptomyces sp. LP05-1]